MVILDSIRKKLIQAIKTSGKTQTELANLIGINQQSVAQYLSGRAMPALDTFANLCAVLDLDANEILCTDEYGKNNRYCSECGKLINNLPANWRLCSECNRKLFHANK